MPGSIRVSGRATTDWDPFELRRQVGYVLQEIALFPAPERRRERRRRAAAARLGRGADRRARRRAARADRPGRSDFATRRPHQLSGGQRQRVGVARALAADPPILLMDEPFGALDPVTRSEMHDEFRRIQAQVRKTILIVTHDMGEAFALAHADRRAGRRRARRARRAAARSPGRPIRASAGCSRRSSRRPQALQGDAP